MKFHIDTESNTLTIDNTKTLDLYSKEVFELLSKLWLKMGWQQKYSYTFTWLGCPIIQIPEDMLRIQELIYNLKPDIIIETGIAHGGSLIFYASLCHNIGQGKIIGIDCEIRAHNRERIENHPLKKYISLIEGDSTSKETLAAVQNFIDDDAKVMVILDSDHSYQHVKNELNAYADFVTKNSYLLIADGIMADLTDVPRGKSSWKSDNPVRAVQEFLQQRPDFVFQVPDWLFNESELQANITYFPQGWLKKI